MRTAQTASEFELDLFSQLKFDCFPKPRLQVSNGDNGVSYIGELQMKLSKTIHAKIQIDQMQSRGQISTQKNSVQPHLDG